MYTNTNNSGSDFVDLLLVCPSYMNESLMPSRESHVVFLVLAEVLG